MSLRTSSVLFFFFNDTATTEIYTLSLHDALPISTSQKLPPIVTHGHAIQARFDGAAGGGLTCETHIHIGCATRRHRLLLPDGVWTNLYSPSSRSPPASWPMSAREAREAPAIVQTRAIGSLGHRIRPHLDVP